MKRKILLAILLLLIVAFFFIRKDYSRTHSTLYINADVVTMESGQPSAEAVYVEEGLIKAIGSKEEVSKYKSSKTKVVDLKGAALLPGFIDPHTHPALSSFFSEMVDLSGFKHSSNASIWNYLTEQVQSTHVGEWIICKGLDPVLVPDLVTPTKSFLDSIAPDNPVFIISQSIHSFWANSLAFAEVGIDKNTPDPSAASYYEKDEQGELTGFLAEQEALMPFRERITEIQGSEVINQSVNTLDDYAKNGNTTIVAMGLTAYEQQVVDFYQYLSGEDPSILNQALATFGILPKRKPMPRHYLYIRFDAQLLLPESEDNGDDHFKVLGVKYWYDGAPYTGSMYLSEPYLDSDFNHDKLHIGHHHHGEALMDQNVLAKNIGVAESADWQVAIHSQGDQSTAEVMDAFEQVDDGGTDHRHRIEHCLMIQTDHLAKMKEEGVHPSFHINHLYYYGDALKSDIIGSDRAEEILPIRTAIDLGLIPTLHSDAPMFPSEPLSLIQTAVERKTKEGYSIGADQAITVMEGLKAMTINGAWQIKMEDKLGSIKVGKYADFVVLNQNPLKVDVADLRDIKVMRTVVGGEDVYVSNE